MAAMPSVSLIRKLTVLGVAIASFGVSASSASASDVWLWACHSPSGEALDVGAHTQFSSQFGGTTARYGDGCANGAADGYGGGGIGSSLSTAAPTVSGQSKAFSAFAVPPGLQLAGVKLTRQTTGFNGATQPNNPITYSAKTSNSVLESTALTAAAPADVTGEATFSTPTAASSGESVNVGVECATGNPNTTCTSAPASVSVYRVGMRVVETGANDDANRPTFALGGTRSPAGGARPEDKIMNLDVRANDGGIGLKSATAFFEGGSAPVSASFGGTNCRELTPDDATVDLPLDADCPHVSNVNLPIDTRQLPDGPGYKLHVVVTDWSGLTSEKIIDTEIANNVNLGQSSQTLSIGTSGNSTPNVVANTNNGGKSGVAGSSSQNCTTPRLSFSLSQKPMRISKGVPVLQSAKRYRFNGRLTCVINKKRRSAPKGARVEITNKIGKKTYTKTGTTVRSDGKLTIILSYKTSRTVTFRFTNSDGKRSTVSIKIKVEKKKKASKR